MWVGGGNIREISIVSEEFCDCNGAYGILGMW